MGLIPVEQFPGMRFFVGLAGFLVALQAVLEWLELQGWSWRKLG